jgi:hypothetical protein
MQKARPKKGSVQKMKRGSSAGGVGNVAKGAARKLPSKNSTFASSITSCT